MCNLVEPRVRLVVAEHLGVGPEELTADVSLIDDLAADSLDLVELAVALEGEMGIEFPESAIDDLRTYGDLVQTVTALERARSEAAAAAADAEEGRPALVWARVVPPHSDASANSLQRAGWLTPYTAETIAEDALRAGRGARLEVTVPPTVSDLGLSQLQEQFAWLGDRGVQVSVRRDHHLGPQGQAPRPHAAA
jgi:acyl carrier protein